LILILFLFLVLILLFTLILILLSTWPTSDYAPRGQLAWPVNQFEQLTSRLTNRILRRPARLPVRKFEGLNRSYIISPETSALGESPATFLKFDAILGRCRAEVLSRSAPALCS
jgi:hypothetical protein